MDLTLRRGDTTVIDFKVTPTGVATGGKLWFTVKASNDDPDPGLIQKTSDPGGGITVSGDVGTVTILPADTAALSTRTVYRWDCQLRDAAGELVTVAGGRLVLSEDTTRATS